MYSGNRVEIAANISRRQCRCVLNLHCTKRASLDKLRNGKGEMNKINKKKKKGKGRQRSVQKIKERRGKVMKGRICQSSGDSGYNGDSLD